MENLIYGSDFGYNQLSIRQSSRRGFRTQIDDNPENEDCGLMIVTEKIPGVVKIVGTETEEGQYEIVMANNVHLEGTHCSRRKKK